MKKTLLLLCILLTTIQFAIKAQDRIYWGIASQNISSAKLDGTDVKQSVTLSGQTFDMETDFYKGILYWGDVASVKKANTDGTNLQTLYTGLKYIGGLALDLTNNKLYFSDFGSGNATIRRCNLDGTGMEVIVTSANYLNGKTYNLAISPTLQKLYWTESTSVNANSIIMRCNLDGTNIETLKATTSFIPGLTIDEKNQRLYLAYYYDNKVMTTDMTCSTTPTLVFGSSNGTFQMSVSNVDEKLYFAELTTKKIRSCNLDGSSPQDIVSGLSGSPMALSIPTVPPAPTIYANETYTFELNDFIFSSVDKNLLTKIKITALTGKGTLYLDANNNNIVDAGEAVVLNQEISKTDIVAGKLKFNPVTNDYGSPYTTFNFKWFDGTNYSTLDYLQYIYVLSVASTVTTQAVSDIGTTTATGNGNITDLGVPFPTSYGVCWNTTGSPTTSNSKVDKGSISTTGAFTAAISGLTANTTYKVRAYATNEVGTSYGTEVTFTTTNLIAPTATTNAATSVTSSGATLNGSINANNASTAVTFEYGLTTSYGTTVTAVQSPVTSSSATAVSYALTGLAPNTTYHYRVIGINSEGTTNGGDMTFSTTDIAPNISYVTPQIYTVGTPIAALTPTNTGGAVVAISSPLISTLAGSGASGSADGLGTAASFNTPVYLAPDAAGNLYISDLGSNMIRKITPAGGVSTLADASAGFNKPAGVVVDPSGNVYVADNDNHRIRKITQAGVVSTLAGSDNGEQGNDNGNGTAARFSGPVGLALDAAGNLYVSDNGNKLIRKITPAGEVTTFAGSGTFGSTDGNGTSASFKSPMGIVIDASGNLYVADSRSNLIRKISPTGDVTTFAGSGAEGSTNGNGTLASFNAPEGIAIDASGNLYIADSENNLIRKINPAGDVTTLAGNGSLGADNGTAETASFGQPYSVALDASGNLYVADTYNNLIRKITQTAYTITPALPVGLSFDSATGTISGTPTTASAATTYTVSAANSGGSSIATISIAVKNPQTIAFDALTAKTYGDATFDLAATSTSGLTVSYSSDNTSVASVSGSTVTIVGAGTANITASQAGDATNLAAADVIQQLTVGKKAVSVTAATDTKTYDGTTVSTVAPTVGTLATDDAINIAPTQAFDNAAVGTTHVLTASGLTIKNGSADVTGNYDISYTTATGTINKLAVTVTAATDTKTYDGTTVSTAIPTVGTLAIGDAINTAPTQAFDNAAVGTAHVLTTAGLTIKNGSADVTGNYDISYATANGGITAKALTMSDPTVTLSKVYDGNTVAAVTAGTLSGIVTSDEGNVTVTAVGNYDNATIGTNKTITVVYTLGGSAAGNYSAPANYLATGAEILSGNITLEPLSNPTPNETNTGLVLSYNVVAGGPTQYQITFEASALAVGIQNVSYTALVTTGTDGSISITVPKGTKPGKYKGTLHMRNDFGVESPAYDFVLTVNIPTEYIAVKYNKVLVLDNSTRMFSTYQWYKDGVAIEGATKQFYRDPKGLVGTYTVQATDINGEILYSYPKVLNIPLALKVTAYPTMVRPSQTCTVEITDEAMELDMAGAELSVYSSKGIRVYHSTKVENLNTIKLPTMNGVYSGYLTTADGQSFPFKVIVAN